MTMSPFTLSCDHCGGAAITSPDGLFSEQSSDRCEACGYPGGVVLEESDTIRTRGVGNITEESGEDEDGETVYSATWVSGIECSYRGGDTGYVPGVETRPNELTEDVQIGAGMTIEEVKTTMLEDLESARIYGQLEGAAVAFGVVGMAEAIRRRRPAAPMSPFTLACDHCGEYGETVYKATWVSGTEPGDVCDACVCSECDAIREWPRR